MDEDKEVVFTYGPYRMCNRCDGEFDWLAKVTLQSSVGFPHNSRDVYKWDTDYYFCIDCHDKISREIRTQIRNWFIGIGNAT